MIVDKDHRMFVNVVTLEEGNGFPVTYVRSFENNFPINKVNISDSCSLSAVACKSE
jgi:hypothetical protein